LWVQSLNDPRVNYTRNEKNLRPSRNYNKAIMLAETEFIVLMGCDDVMLPAYVERVKHLIAQHPDASVIQPGVNVIDEHSANRYPLPDRVKGWYRPRGKGTRELRGESLATSLLRGNWTYFPSLTWRTEILRSSGFRTDLDIVQDLAKLFEIVSGGGSLVLDDQPVFSYRRHSRSVSAVTGPDGTKFVQEAKFFDEANTTARKLGWVKAARAASIHLSSRLNALTELPRAVLGRNPTGRHLLLRHVLGGFRLDKAP
jgi:glycosyltransferase involved in cell wall biosynthesis